MTDTERLEKIAQNTEPKTSNQIVVSENWTKIKTTFNPPKNKDNFQPTNRVGSNAKIRDGFGEFRDVL